MYLPKQFEETRIEVLHALMRERPLATLVVTTGDGLEANHIPLLVDAAPAPFGPFGTLRGHVARANPMWHEFDAATEVLAVFSSPGAYVTPSWYATKREHGKVVPTWNYAVVHAKGPLLIRDDRTWLRAHLEQMVATHEAPFPLPWKIGDAPAEFIDNLVKAVVGFEIPIRSLHGKWKVSQNRSAADRRGVVEGLGAQDDDEAQRIAALVAGDPVTPA